MLEEFLLRGSIVLRGQVLKQGFSKPLSAAGIKGAILFYLVVVNFCDSIIYSLTKLVRDQDVDHRG